ASVAGGDHATRERFSDGKLREGGRDLVEERALLRAGQGIAVRQRQAVGIALLVVDAELVVEVRTRRPSRLTDESDDVSLTHAHAGPHRVAESGQMRVNGAA